MDTNLSVCIEIKIADVQSDDFQQFKNWLIREWSIVDQLPVTNEPKDMPLPLLAYVDGQLAGGLSYIHYKKPESENMGLWINTVYVAPNFRGLGVGRQLVSEAMAIAVNYDDDLYVYTDKPSLYTKLGWRVVQAVEDHFVLINS